MNTLRPLSVITSVALAATIAACSSTETRTLSSREHGEALFSDPATTSTDNVYSCATCHVADGVPPNGSILPGAPLAGVTKRPSFWGGAEGELLRAINSCRTRFMATEPWTADAPDAQATWAYLASLPPSRVEAIPFTVVRSVVDLPPGDANAGRGLYDQACASCHGAAKTGAGRSTPRAVALPDAALRELGPAERRIAFIEKIRQGAFLGKTGTMPPFSKEVLSDADVASILAFLAL